MIRHSSSVVVVLLLLAACQGRSDPATVRALSSGAATPISTVLPVATGDCGSAETAAFTVTNNGRRLSPVGRMTTVGDFPTGGALSPDGRFYWAVDSGDGRDDVKVVNVASGEVVQTLPLPGAFGQAVFAPDGKSAYVSGEPQGVAAPSGPTLGDAGDVIHVFTVDPASGHATEQTPISIPPPSQTDVSPSFGLPPSTGPTQNWPAGLALTPDGKTLLVALYNTNKVALIDIARRALTTTLAVGKYPLSIAVERNGKFAYVGNEMDGTLSKIDIAAQSVATTISGLGGALGDNESHVEAVIADPLRDRLYVAVANRDAVAVVDTQSDTVAKIVSLRQGEVFGTQPVALALTPDGQTLYAADSGEDALAAIALAPRGNYQALDVIGRVPTANYPHDVRVSANGCLIWTAAKGLNVGANPGYQGGTNGTPFANSGAAPYGTYVLDMLLGRVGVLPLPTDGELAAQNAPVQAQLRASNAVAPPAFTPIHAADGGPSQQIKYVFLVVKENRTYDQLFGTDPRGNGNPSLELFDDNGVAGPAGGITPNAHGLTRMFPLFDNFYEDSEVSVDGHLITTGAYAIDYMQRAEHPSYSNRGGPDTTDGNPVEFPAQDFLFDQAVRQGVTFRNYGEFSGGSTPYTSDDGRSTYKQVIASMDLAYSPIFGCLSGQDPTVPNGPSCSFDSGLMVPPPLALSRVDEFNADFQVHVRTGLVPQFSYITLPNDHTNGTTPGVRTPQAMVADNDLGLGQLVQIISSSSIWPQSAIFVMEDDSQDGADHVDAHRAPAYVISPWAAHGVVVHTRYDQYSVLRTIEAILGLKPQYLTDAGAVPMYDAFTGVPDNSPYAAVMPTQDLTAKNTAASANAALSALLPWNKLDAVPQEISDRILWQAVYGAQSPPPAPGPNASATEHERGVLMLQGLMSGHGLPVSSDID